jgi:iron(III) transport system ATP-binding protein
MHSLAIRLEGVSKSFGTVPAVVATDLAVEAGEFLALLGPSGCGKTTLLRLIAGFERPDDGDVVIAGRKVSGSQWVPPERRRVGMVFQDYALFPHRTVAENVGYGVPRRLRRERVVKVLALVGLAGYEHRYPHALSGGEQQRVALARALAPEPAIVLLDEPWSSIDPLVRSSMREELAAILRAAGVTAVLVTHDREEAFSLADRIALMRAGTVVQTASGEDLYLSPTDRWAAQFVGAGNFLPGRLADGHVETAIGRFPVTNGNGSVTVEALIRPELLALRPDPAGPGEVVGREFRGHDVFCRVRVGEAMLLSQRPSDEFVALGARVALEPRTAPIPVFP